MLNQQRKSYNFCNKINLRGDKLLFSCIFRHIFKLISPFYVLFHSQRHLDDDVTSKINLGWHKNFSVLQIQKFLKNPFTYKIPNSPYIFHQKLRKQRNLFWKTLKLKTRTFYVHTARPHKLLCYFRYTFEKEVNLSTNFKDCFCVVMKSGDYRLNYCPVD